MRLVHGNAYTRQIVMQVFVMPKAPIDGPALRALTQEIVGPGFRESSSVCKTFESLERLVASGRNYEQ
jgi:hypothetical protein